MTRTFKAIMALVVGAVALIAAGYANAAPTLTADPYPTSGVQPDSASMTVNGVFAGEHHLAWRRHDDMGVEGPWIVWYFGGVNYPPHLMHFQQGRFILAKRRIGV